ncbi:MAG: hypothetical protein Q4C30_09965 [Bacteroidia bacterium]|nr:hypothetical protein [Bacteroidia bacterium]
MKLSYKLFAATLAFAGLVACTPDEFTGADALNCPSIQEVKDDISISVDQSTNTVTFSIDAKGVMPLWIFEGEKETTYSTRNGLQKIYTVAGDYTVKVKVGNRNGWSDMFVERSFHIDNTLIDFSKYETYLAGAAGNAEWRIDYVQDGHMGCGPSGTEGLVWWSATPSAKANEGVYDDRLSFSGDGVYNYTPGDGGTMYINYGASIFPEYNTEAETDFMAPVEAKQSSYSLSVEGTDLILTLAPNSYFPYIPNDDFWANPRFVVLNMNSKSMELVTDNGAIAWHFILTSVKDVEVFKGFKYDSEFNMWKNASIEPVSFFYAPGWSQLPNPEVTAVDNKSYSFIFPSATTDQWQAQTFLVSNVALEASKSYDVSFIISSNKDLPKVTAKLHRMVSLSEADDNTSLLAEVGSLSVKAGEDFVYYASELPGIDAEFSRFVFDFGGCPDNTEVTISNIVIKDHANDDGTVLPSPTPDAPEEQVTWDDAANLITSAEKFEIFYADENWTPYVPEPEFSAENGLFSTLLPYATSERWKAQFKFHTNAATSADKAYDFKMSFTPSNDIKGVTIKLVQSGDDNVFLTDGQHDLIADVENVITVTNLEGKDIANLDIVIDFGGNPANTSIKFGNFHLQEHKGPKVVDWNYDSDKNLFKSANVETIHFYYAPNWSELPKPECAVNGSSYSFSLPEATTEQWQAQFALKTDMSTSANKKYDFHVIINSSKDIAKATIKMVLEGDDNTFYFTEFVSLEADTDLKFTMTDMPGIDMSKVNFFFDFGGNPAGTDIVVKDIIVYEAE